MKKQVPKSGLPLAISTPQWRFLSDDAIQKRTGASAATGVQKGAKAGSTDREREGEVSPHGVGEYGGDSGRPTAKAGQRTEAFKYTKSVFLDQLGEELADDTVPKEDIIRMLEEAVGEEVLLQSDYMLEQRLTPEGGGSGRGTEATEGGQNLADGAPVAGDSRNSSPSAREKAFGRPPQASPSVHAGGASLGISAKNSSQLIKNPRYMRQIREVARRTSLGTIQGLTAKRNRNYREPKKVPAVMADKSLKEEGDGFWSDEEEGEEGGIHHSTHSPTGHQKDKEREITPEHIPRRGSQPYPIISPKSVPAPRPQSPVIIWRPNASVRLATDLPRECLNNSILNPQQDMKLTDLIKSDRGFDPLSVIKSNSGQSQLPPEMKKTFSYYKQFVSNTMPSADEEKEVLSSKSRPEWGKRIPPSPKSEYGAWYIPPDLWESDMRLSTKNKEKKVQLMRENLWNTSIFDDSRKGTMEAGLTDLEIQEAQISEQIPNQYSSKMYKEYIKKKQGRLPHYLERLS
ncbi:hypothetical protein HOP50_04g29330 [Chloropicon primus]|uniref:Uncharacterized protein n=1 Tax=Chloropicon primus TaxID=1764295 RepID=A0A5B8MIU1_9CHLO|nr:hypothetical protein A3770_04p29340 [Chloropicon primus]UPQ99625.1 hypothetical protein HOP50_04g29330 [Chloropicon primus]|eukprot:QDZ20416.1 hypothetical protein A3770_04p29340 [Chloropicon primus]